MADLELSAAVHARGLDVAFEVPDGQTVALLGANGAGKSTVLSVVAGLLAPDRGRVSLGGRVLTDDRRRVPTHKRRIGLLAQEAALFPHLSVRANIAFGPKAQGLRDANRRTAEWLTAVNATDLASRRPGQLSGGQQQRIALARALAGDPELVLLDEPLAALDVSVAEDLRHLLARHLVGRTTIVVTHDLLDVLALADRIITLDAGRIVEDGPVNEVLSAPRSGFTARLAGLNLLPGSVLEIADGTLRVQVGPWQVTGVDHVTAAGAAPANFELSSARRGDAVVALAAPSAIAIHHRDGTDPPAGSPRNALAAQVVDLQATPSGVRIRTTAENAPTIAADITAAAANELRLTPGTPVWLTVKAQEVAVHPTRS